METACDMDKPVGYWVQQTRSDGETIARRKSPVSLPAQAKRRRRRPSRRSVI